MTNWYWIRHGPTHLKSLVGWSRNKTIDSVQATSSWEIDADTSATNNAKNKAMRREGRTTEQTVFGRMPRLPHMHL